jgi:hypothetical protein
MKLGSLAFPLPETPNSSIQVMSVAVLELETEARLKTSAATPQSSWAGFTSAIGPDRENVKLSIGTGTGAGLDLEGPLFQLLSASAPQSSPPDVRALLLLVRGVDFSV